MRVTFRLQLTCVLLGICFSFSAIGQKPQHWPASDIALALQKLEVLGNVLYMAAHPDDENTRLIAWLANEKKYNTAYLSLTRGDGGQNLIGPELRERLGIIRTQELLQARATDGGQQFFTRANDFGYSKHPDETFNIWDKEAVLADAVWVIRKFKPDVIITRFSTQPGETHGHHTASAILAEEAFEAAADPKRFPEQLAHVQTWQVKRLLWNTSSWFFQGRESAFDTASMVQLKIGGYNPLLGKSYTEVAAESRSMHRSQGFGAALSRENPVEYLKPILGGHPGNELFNNIRTDWGRVKGGEKIGVQIKKILQSFELTAPWKSIDELVNLHKNIKQLPDNPYKTAKLQELETIIGACLGLYAEASSQERSAAPGTSVDIKLEIVNRSPVAVQLQSIALPSLNWDSTTQSPLAANVPLIMHKNIEIPGDITNAHPYWLIKTPTKGMFQFDELELTGKAENDPPVQLKLLYKVQGLEVPLSVPLVHKHLEPAAGEIYQPFVITPGIMVTPLQDQLIFSTESSQQLGIRVRSGQALEGGELSLGIPKGWQTKPAAHTITALRKGEEKLYYFEIIPPKTSGSGVLKVTARINNQTFSRGFETIVAPHFPVQTLFPEAKVEVVRLDLELGGKRLGYIAGAGDALPDNLQQVGYEVSMLDAARLQPGMLATYDAVILGVRAFNTQEALKHTKSALEAYAQAGGVVFIQYNTSHALVTSDLAPFPIKLGRSRITDETAPVQLIAPDHPALNYPNKITEQDFDGWVQERGLYFPDQWSKEWQPLLSSHDAGEQPLKGGLLVAPVGKGYYVYGAYSWFRQLPAGVPGAYRLLANLLALGNKVTD